MKRKKFLIVILAFSLIWATGCSLFAGNVTNSTNDSKKSNTTNPEIGELIKDCFNQMYKLSIETNYENAASGKVDGSLIKWISRGTQNEAENNKELPIHYPRYLSVSGMTLIDYKICTNDKKEEILLNSIGESNGEPIYYVKVNLIAGGVADKDFALNFTRNGETGVYTKNPNAQVTPADYIKIQVKYDVKFVKENGKYKIKTLTEAGSTPMTKNRLLVLNNDHVKRLLYLNVVDTEDGKIKAQAEDIKTFNDDKKVIDNFFNKIIKLDATRMSLLKSEWEKDKNTFAKFLEFIGLKDDKGILLGDDTAYKNNFSYDAFPLRSGMEKIEKLDSLDISVHPAYSKNNKIYLVKFKTSVEEKDGILANPNDYSYEYMIWVSEGNVMKMKLNNMYKIVNK